MTEVCGLYYGGADMEQHEVLIVGGGNAGISLGARLIRDGVRDVTIVAPQPVHRYKPLLNYVSAGQATMADLERPMGEVVPRGADGFATPLRRSIRTP